MSSASGQPPSLTKVALAAVKPNVSRHKGYSAEAPHAPPHRDGDAENATSMPACGPPPPIDTAADKGKEHLPAGLPFAGPLCIVSFTGFRDDDDDDEVGEAESDDQLPHGAHNAEAAARGDASGAQTTALSRCERLAIAAAPRVQVQSTLTSATTVLVARRGFTQKRLLAARRGIPVVHPGWVARGCPPLPVGGRSDGAYVVPWLYGYVFSTTGLSTSERAAIERVCGVHGATLEAALTYRCDVLLTGAECVQALQRLLTQEEGERNGWGQRHQRLRQHESSPLPTPLHNTADARGGDASLAPWLTEKVRSALECDVPVVDYVRLFSVLRLDRLPPPTWLPSTARRGSTSSHSAGVSAEAEADAAFRDALDGRDFDALVEACRVGAPADGSAGWRRLLRTATAPTHTRHGRSTADGAVEAYPVGDGDAAAEEEEVFLATAADAFHDDRASRSSSTAASGTTCSASASTLSDPDAWEDFLSTALAASLHAPEDRPRAQRTDLLDTNEHDDRGGASGGWRDMTINTADVDVIADAYPVAERATAHVPFADYYSATDTAAGIAESMADSAPPPWPPAVAADGSAPARVVEEGHVLWGLTAVDPSPRLTTNALLQRDTSKPRPAVGSANARGIVERGSGGLAAPSPVDCTAAYYATHRTAERLPAPQPVPLSRSAHSMADSLTTGTQVLVESCQMPDELEHTADLAAREVASPTECVGPPSSHRFTLPLMALHPPYLTVCLLGCSEAELLKAVRWCAQCRLLRSPVPTPSTDLVVLGSRVLAKRRYTVRADVREPNGVAGSGGRPRHAILRRAVAAAAQQQEQQRQHGQRHPKAGDGAVSVTVRYWEADAAIARTLADVCGLPLSRLVPFVWLEDAAAASAAAAAAAQSQPQQEAACADPAPDAASDEWDTAATLPETLDADVQSRLAAAIAVAEEAQRAAALDASAKQQQQPVFQPLPALTPEQLPNTAEPKYYIRLRRASSGAPWAGDLGPAAAAAGSAGWPASPPSGDAASGRASVRDSALLSAFQVGGTRLPTNATASPHVPAEAVEGTAEDKPPVVVSGPASTVGSTTVPLPGQPPPQLHCSSVSNGIAGPAEVQRRGEENAHEAALAAAGRRFNQLVALFTVTDEGAHEAGDAGQRHAVCESSHRAQTFATVLFCCVEGEYARVDWAVVRGLVRYGGGRVEKRTDEAWHAALQLLGPAKPKKPAAGAGVGNAQLEETAVPTLPDSVMKALRWSSEHAKLRQKLRRAQQRQGGASSRASAHRTTSPAEDELTESRRSGGDEEGASGAAAVARLSAKLQRVAQQCERMPVLSLVPHSFQRAAAATASTTATETMASTSVGSAAATSPHSRRHVLSRLLPVTVDYVLASLAVGRCLSPDACFLFHACIPSAPDVRLLHHPHPGGGGGAPGCGTHASPLQTRRPALSPWLLERRYSKADSVGVCVAVLWRLPAPSPSPTPADSTACWSQADALTSRTVPAAPLVPLLRVLLLGLRNAVTALGGQLVDAVVPSAVTHVLVMDVDTVVTSNLKDAFTSGTGAGSGKVEAGTSVGAYWPLDYDLGELVQCAARDDVALVGPAWLEACVQWGVFVDEKDFAAPADLMTRVEAERHKRAVAAAHAAQTKARLQQQQQRRKREEASQHSARNSTVRATPALALAHLVDGQRKRERTPPLQRERLDVQNLAGDDVSTQEGCHTPVVRRAGGGKDEERDVDPCTPPPRRPHPLPSLQHPARTPAASGSGAHSTGCIRAGSITHTPPPSSSALEHARRRSSPSASQHNTWSLMEQHDAEAYVEHLGSVFNFCSPGSTPLPASARRRPDRERSTAAHAEAGVSLLAHLMPHAQASQPSAETAASAHATPERPARATLRSTSLPARHSTPASSERTRVLTPRNVARGTAAPPGLASQATEAEKGTSVTSTPRRRTLRDVAAAAAATRTSPSTQRSALSSPDRQRRRTGEREGVAASATGLNDAQQPSVASPELAGTAPCAAAAGVSAALPDVLGGSTLHSTRRGTEDGSVRGAGTDVSTRRSTAQLLALPRPTEDCRTMKDTAEHTTPVRVGNEESVVVPSPPRSPSEAHAGDTPAHAEVARVAGFSWMDEVVPGTPHARRDDVLEPASFVAATAEACEPTPAIAGVAGANGEAASTRRGMPLEDEESCVAASLGSIDMSPSPHRDAAAAAAAAAAGADAAGAAGAPPPTLTSAVRQSSPSPCPLPAEVVDVDMADDAEDEEGAPRRADTRDGVSRVSPWTRHRPLSLSRRPSRSPPPQTPHAEAKNATAPARTTSAVRRAPTSPPASTSSSWMGLSVYVLHDLPLRDVRVRRCHEALDQFARTTMEAAARCGARPPPPHGAASPATGSTTAVTAPPAQPAPPPLAFVSRCEDADVVVTHEVNLRESVLVGVVRGCWVVAPRFMEVAAAVLRDADSHSQDGSDAARGGGVRCAVEAGGVHGPVLALRPAPASTAPASPAPAAAAVHAACRARLLEALQECEWEPGVLPCAAVTATSAADTDATAAVQRSLLLQCRRQRLARATQPVGRRPVARAPLRGLFHGLSVIGLYAHARTAACDGAEGGASLSVGSPRLRLRAIERVVVAGGGRVCAAVEIDADAAAAVRNATAHTNSDAGEASEERTSLSLAAAASAAASSCTPPLRPRSTAMPALRCCRPTSAPTPSAGRSNHENDSDVKAGEDTGDASSGVVADAALYHDLVWLLCRAVREQPADTLVVLLDASLLRLPPSGTAAESGGGAVRVSVSGPRRASPAVTLDSGETAHDAAARAALQPPKKRRTETCRAGADGRGAKEPTMSSAQACTVAQWLASWLLSPSDPVVEDASAESPYAWWAYSAETAAALRAHLQACCRAAAPSSCDGRGVQSTLEKQADETRTHLPFDVPTVTQVREVFTGADAATSTRAGAPEGQGVVRRVEFRSTSWVGACVSAGGAAALAAGATTAGRGRASDAPQSWMRLCEGQTLWGSLSLV